jgi:hypothetical protein
MSDHDKPIALALDNWMSKLEFRGGHDVKNTAPTE